MVIASSGHTTKMHAHGRCRSRGRTERAHRSLENRSERGFPQRPHAASLFWRKKEQNPRCQPASHTKFLTLPIWLLANDLPRQRAGLALESGSPLPRKWIPLHRSGATPPAIWCRFSAGVALPIPRRDAGVAVRGHTPRANRVTLLRTNAAPFAVGRSVLDRDQAIPAARWRGGVARRASPRRALRVHPRLGRVIPSPC
jgi:hypothetical protein